MSKDTIFMKKAFPEHYAKDIELIATHFKYDRSGYHDYIETINLNDEKINLPSRIYYLELTDSELVQFTEMQQRLVWCYYISHHNGYVRQKYLLKILESGEILEHEIPYIVSEIGSYVYEIIEDIYRHFDLLIESGLEKFVENNIKYARTTWGRLASYWGEYYGSIPKREYCGFKIQRYFNQVLNKNGRKI